MPTLSLLYLIFKDSCFQSSFRFTANCEGTEMFHIPVFHTCISPLCMCMLNHFNCVWLFVILWTVTCQAPLPMGFHRQEYWNGLPFPSPGHLPNPGIKPVSVLYNPVISITHQMVLFFFFFFTKERCSLSQSLRVNGLHYVSFLVVGILCITDTIHYSFLQNIFTAPPNLLCSPTLLLTTTSLFIVCIVLPFPECHIVGIIP